VFKDQQKDGWSGIIGFGDGHSIRHGASWPTVFPTGKDFCREPGLPDRPALL